MTTLLQDLRYAIRTLRQSPGFAFLAIATLALGIGANTAIFSLVHAVLLRPLPFGHADRVVAVLETWRGRRGDVSAGNFADLRAASRSFDRLAAVRYSSLNLAENDAPQRVTGARVTEDFFGIFGVASRLGRVFRPEEDRPGAGNVVVLSDRLWRSQFGGARDVLGRTLRLDGEPYTVVGVMPASFDYVSDNEELWIPAAFNAEALANYPEFYLPVAQAPDEAWDWTQRTMTIVVRSAGADAASLSGAVRTAARAAAPGVPLYDVATMGERMRGSLAQDRFNALLLVSLGGIGLLLAAVGIYGIISYFVVQRRPEFGVRMALGATGGDIVRLTVRQSVAPVLLGLGGGVAAAAAASRVLASTLRGVGPRDPLTFGAVVVVLACAAALASYLPARRAARVSPSEALRND